MSSAGAKIRVCAACDGEVREAWVEWTPQLKVGDAARQSDLVPADEIAALGIYGRRVEADQLVLQSDRVEIYRRLVREPREHRRARAAQRARG